MNNISFKTDSEYEVKTRASYTDDGSVRCSVNVFPGTGGILSPVKISFEIPACGIMSVWTPAIYDNCYIRPFWDPSAVDSGFALNAPVMSLIGLNDENICTVYLDDAFTPIRISGGIIEESAVFRTEITLFSSPFRLEGEYRAEIYIDRRKIDFCRALEDAKRKWTQVHPEAYVPENAKLPMYSTWYSMHQELMSDDLLYELRLAKDYGMDTVIIDDGWQTENSERGYAYCGDWEVCTSKINDMEQLVRAIHGIGMKCMLWFSVPYVGARSKAFDRLRDMMLYTNEDGENSVGTLDLRFPQARSYLAGIYERALTEWHIDGFKLDFIDSIHYKQPYCEKPGMDCKTIEQGILQFLNETVSRMKKTDPEVMIEFRQQYIGPGMCSYGNMLRIADCPLGALRNRAWGLKLRLCSGNIPVHSDMLMWNYNDTVENAANQLLNVLFTVPQISVRIEKLPETHKKMLRFLLFFWTAHRETILNGSFSVRAPHSHYSSACAQTEKECITVLYSGSYLQLCADKEKTYIFNASGTEDICLKITQNNAKAKIYDCMGSMIAEYSLNRDDVTALDIPMSGMAEILPQM